MRQQYEVSVVIPCLNRAHFLVPTIESILQQDYPHIECIVVDGGSTDETIDILKKYEGRIQWISEPDHGHADAVNKGWRMSNGEILAWLNADDMWVVPDAVGQVVAFFQENPEVDVLYGDCGAIDAEGNLIGMSYLHEWELEYAVEYCDHCIPQPASFIRRRILEKVGWLDTAFHNKQDQDLWFRIGLTGNIQYLGRLLAHARNTKVLSFDGRKAAMACIQVTRKFFTLPYIPTGLRRKKPRALSNSYLRGMDYAFEGGRYWQILFSYALRAILVDVTNTRNAMSHLASYAAIGAKEEKLLHWVALGMEFASAPVRILRETKRKMGGLQRSGVPNLLGDRDIEWSWISSQMPSGPGEALDFGPRGSPHGLIAAQRSFRVTAVDLEPVNWPYDHSGVRFLRGDILKLPLPKQHFDLVINCSTVEHVGLAGRYGVTENRSDGDLEAMSRLKEFLKPGGVMLLTIPVGQDAVFEPLCRVYGAQRLPRLLEDYEVEKEEYWVKDSQNRWIIADSETALNFAARAGSWDPLENVYALGCFVLKRP